MILAPPSRLLRSQSRLSLTRTPGSTWQSQSFSQRSLRFQTTWNHWRQSPTFREGITILRTTRVRTCKSLRHWVLPHKLKIWALTCLLRKGNLCWNTRATIPCEETFSIICKVRYQRSAILRSWKRLHVFSSGRRSRLLTTSLILKYKLDLKCAKHKAWSCHFRLEIKFHNNFYL